MSFFPAEREPIRVDPVSNLLFTNKRDVNPPLLWHSCEESSSPGGSTPRLASSALTILDVLCARWICVQYNFTNTHLDFFASYLSFEGLWNYCHILRFSLAVFLLVTPWSWSLDEPKVNWLIPLPHLATKCWNISTISPHSFFPLFSRKWNRWGKCCEEINKKARSLSIFVLSFLRLVRFKSSLRQARRLAGKRCKIRSIWAFKKLFFCQEVLLKNQEH